MWLCCSSRLSWLPGRVPLAARVWPEGFVLPPPAIGEELSLRSRGEYVGVQELIPQPTLERLGQTVLPRRSRLHGIRCIQARCLTGCTVVIGEGWFRVKSGELLPNRNQVLGLAAPANLDGQAEGASGELSMTAPYPSCRPGCSGRSWFCVVLAAAPGGELLITSSRLIRSNTFKSPPLVAL